jgi:hypothetical protein
LPHRKGIRFTLRAPGISKLGTAPHDMAVRRLPERKFLISLNPNIPVEIATSARPRVGRISPYGILDDFFEADRPLAQCGNARRRKDHVRSSGGTIWRDLVAPELPVAGIVAAEIAISIIPIANAAGTAGRCLPSLPPISSPRTGRANQI